MGADVLVEGAVGGDKVSLVSHASLLMELGASQILTDVWIDRPAFGSWLPAVPPFLHPVYLAAMSHEPDSYLAISHAHDDHLDNHWLGTYFDKRCPVIINKFPGPSLANRLAGLGFENIIAVDARPQAIGDFEVMSIVDPTVSNDDGGLAFRNGDVCVYHGNDNWFPMAPDNADRLRAFAEGRRFLYASQTNSASGFPLTYPQLTGQREETAVRAVVRGMVAAGLNNAAATGADWFLGYAGFSRPYVKGKDYASRAFSATYDNLIALIGDDPEVPSALLLDAFPGSTISLATGEVSKPLRFDPETARRIADAYYHDTGIVERCDTYRLDGGPVAGADEVAAYLAAFDAFVGMYLSRAPGFYASIIGKVLKFNVDDGGDGFSVAVTFGGGVMDAEIADQDANKVLQVPGTLMKAIIDKEIVLENLYTGFGAEVTRYPADVYNRDIVQYLVMFGYKYMNAPA